MRKSLGFTGILLILAVAGMAAADLPVRQVILYKHGVGFFVRSGDLAAGDAAQLAFKAGEMNDVLKSLTIVDASGAAIAGVRYDASEPVENRLAEFPFKMDGPLSLAAFLDQMKGARLELTGGPVGTIVSARMAQSGDPSHPAEREMVVLMTDAGDIRSIDLNSVSGVRLTDPKLQTMLRDYLGVLSGARSRDRRNVYIDATKNGTRQVTASYMIPSAVWKSSYRLIFPQAGDKTGKPTLEGWAIIDNTSGDDWTNVNLSVVSGRPISFVTGLYEPRYVKRPTAELAEGRAVAPQLYEGAAGSGMRDPYAVAQMLPGVRYNRSEKEAVAVTAASTQLKSDGASVTSNMTLKDMQDLPFFNIQSSTLAGGASGNDLGELFEYRFSTPVTVKQGQSAMLPFLQQKLDARKLLIYSESYGLHPMNAAELTNTTGKTLDGGPITVYDGGAYAGEALVETLKADDKRLISYGVDLGTRITTKIDSSAAVVNEIHAARGVLTVKNSIKETKIYTINNVDDARKTIVIEHPLRQGYTLLSDQKPKELTSTAQRFEVNVGAKAGESFVVKEERIYNQGIQVSSLTPDVLTTWIQNEQLTPGGRMQLEAIAAKKNDVAANTAELSTVQVNIASLGTDQQRFRENINTLRGVAGQEALVQQYARQLSGSEARLTSLRDRQAELGKKGQTLQAELNTLIEKANF